MEQCAGVDAESFSVLNILWKSKITLMCSQDTVTGPHSKPDKFNI
jgi:hypothetical protein